MSGINRKDWDCLTPRLSSVRRAFTCATWFVPLWDQCASGLVVNASNGMIFRCDRKVVSCCTDYIPLLVGSRMVKKDAVMAVILVLNLLNRS